ncbi:MAG TPA: hypothetical protein PKK67_04215 [Cyclobacteriaceae bacterium]|nr:hypothetical protein [Cyclobacteriaceae bacterium]
MRSAVLISIVLCWGSVVQGQELIFTPPIALSSSINTNDEELAPVLSPDGNTLYFIRAFHEGNNGGKFAGSDIWMSRKDEQGQWMPAIRMDNSWNNKRSNAVIGISANQSVVYLLNAYNNKSGISFSKFLSGQWQQPEFIPVPGINRDDFVGFYVHPQFDVILISMKGKDTLGEEDLYISLKDSSGNWTEPRNLGPSINTSGFEISPFLSEDKKRLYFSSNGHGGYGDADIFYCERLFDSWETWGVPKNLGETINSSAFEAYFTLKAKDVFFVSNRVNANLSDVYASSIRREVTEVFIDRKYLSSKEIAELIGASVSNSVSYNNNISALDENQRELLYFIANKLITKTEIKIQLTAFGLEGQGKLNNDRFRNIMAELMLSGIDNFRIQVTVIDSPLPADLNRIELRYFR